MTGQARATTLWRRSVALIKMLGIRSSELTSDQVVKILMGMNFNAEEAEQLMLWLDGERKGTVTLADLTSFFKRPIPAKPSDLYHFYVFVVKKWGGLKTAFDALDLDHDGEVSAKEFENEVEKAGWKGISAEAIFAVLDSLRRSGFLSREEFELLGVYKNVHSMNIVCHLRDLLLTRYRSMEMAFRAADTNKSGAISKEEFIDFCKAIKFADADLFWQAFQFIDMDCSGIISVKEFQALTDFDVSSFLKGIHLFRDQCLKRYGNLENAFKRMDCLVRADGGIDFGEFVVGCDRIDIKNFTSIEPRRLYHFIDSSCNNVVSPNEFLQLRCFNVDAAEARLRECHSNLIKRLGDSPEKGYQILLDKAAKLCEADEDDEMCWDAGKGSGGKNKQPAKFCMCQRRLMVRGSQC